MDTTTSLLQYPPGTKILARPPSKSKNLSRVDHALVSISSLVFVGSVVWVPIAYSWAWKKWKQIPKEDKKRRALYGVLLLSIFSIHIAGPHRRECVGKWLNMRRWRLWKAWMNFIAFEVVSDVSAAKALPSEEGGYQSTRSRDRFIGTSTKLNNVNKENFDLTRDQAIFAVVPHGIFPFALAFAALPQAAVNVFGKFRPVVATATTLFPFVNTFLKWLRAVDASKSAVDRALSEGSRIGLSPGGIAEMFEGYPKPGTHPDNEYAILNARKGFIRMAIKHGLPVVPIYCFGGSKMLKRLQLPAFVEKLSNFLRISICLFFGPWGLPIPFRTRLMYVVGKPIYPAKNESGPLIEGSTEFKKQVDQMHAQFCSELKVIFDKYKHSYGWGHKRLQII